MRSVRSRRWPVLLGFVWTLASLAIFGPRAGVAQATAAPYDEIARQTVAQRYGLPIEALTIGDRKAAEYPLQALSATDYKVEDTRDGSLYRVTLRPDGTVADPEALEQGEIDAYAGRYGKLDVALADHLASLPAGEPVQVMIWFHAVGPHTVSRPALISDPDAPKPTEDEIDQIYQEVDGAWAATVEAAVRPAADRLKALGYDSEGDPYNPVLFATLPAEAIAQVNSWPEVQRIYLDTVNQPELSIAVPAVLGDAVHGRGINGANVRIGQIEVGGRVAVANPSLAGVIQDGAFVCAAPSTHSTGVAGIIRSTHGIHRGTAPGAVLWAGGSCGGVSSQLTNRSTAAANWGARALNLSWGANIGLVPGVNDRFYDTLVLNRWRTVVKSAGNEAGPCGSGTGNVTSPGLAYNIITVGNFDDHNTVSWADDAMNNCSSWRDPVSTHNDREKPEVAAPGTTITSTTTAFPWTGAIGSGTSYAAPIVTGATALLIQRNGFFSVWPEAVKALLMVTAVNDIDNIVPLGEFDGAGGIALDRADDVAGGVTGGYGGRWYDCATPVNLDIATVWMASGIRTRVAIAWDTDPNYSNYNNQPAADLDLRVISPGNWTVASSLSWDNTYEIVDFVPNQTGFHRIRVNKFRCSFNPQWLGWAWRQGN